MIPEELIKKIKQIQIYTSRAIDASFAGQYESVFKGRGMQFDEVGSIHPAMISALLTGMSPPVRVKLI